MKIPTETPIRSKAIYFLRLKNRPERIVLRQPRRMHPEKGKKRREGHACGHPCSKSILSIILPRLTFKPRRLELARVAVDLVGRRLTEGMMLYIFLPVSPFFHEVCHSSSMLFRRRPFM
ncbi:hypothetical protein AVEN_237023-1 [Araneus ventricosus]|uniref:Uncharacterized protein n=1 Tax=Araneus ventricosus TaxID=182803 RepID=A0A4Y2NYW9_ARAVE|nr:hypothetical protein AVEN_237023-1 [Araneus ventricosus]